MRMLVLWLAAAATLPFWDAKPPADWTDDEVQEMLTRSPWVQQAVAADSSPRGVAVYLATARPIRAAEAEREKRAREKGEQPAEGADEDTEYADFLREHEGNVIVLSVAVPNPSALDDVTEAKMVEELCVLRVGRNKYKMVGHFPPSASDPRLRLVFPRSVRQADKSFGFDLYVPGAQEPLRFVQFRVADLTYKGKPEF
jgi:hypothetical protein